MKIRNYSVNYERKQLKQRQVDIFPFLSLCRQLEVEGASLHIRNLENTQLDYLKRVRRAYLDHGLAMGLVTVSTDFGQPQECHAEELGKARDAMRVALFLGAPLLHLFAGKPPSEKDRANAFARAVAGVRQVCVEAAKEGLPVGLQNPRREAQDPTL